MSRLVRVSLVSVIALACILALMPAPAQARVFAGGGFHGGFYGGGFYGPAWGWGGWYGPGWWGPGYYGYWGPPAGSVKILQANKADSVYIDGGYAGTVGDIHKFSLRPGAHDIAVQSPNGQTLYNQRIEILNGKTTKIHIPG